MTTGGQVGQDATRRGVLAATAAVLPLLAGGCKGIRALGPPPRPQADVGIARAAITAETLMITRYKAVMAAIPALDGRLAPLLSQHEEHLARLRGRLVLPRTHGDASSPPPSGQTPAGAPTAGAPTAGAVPAAPAAAVAFLRQAEDAAATVLTGQLQHASPSFAQLLASIAASEATHALVLGSRRRRA
jgi:hypothetical protein